MVSMAAKRSENMRWRCYAVLCLLLISACHAANFEDSNGTVLTLRAKNWDSQMLSRDRSTLVMFHVDWCGVCKRTFPIFVEACNELTELQFDAKCAHVDCGTEKQLCERNEVKGYPSIRLFPAGQDPGSRDVRCPRTKVGFISYMKRMAKDPVQRLDSAVLADTGINAFLEDEPLASLVTVLAEGAEIPFGIKAASETWRDRHSFFSVPELSVAFDRESPAFKASEGATLVSYSTPKQQWAANNETAPAAVAVFSDTLAVNETTHEWIKANRFPGVWKLNDGIFSEFVRAGRKICVLVVNPWQNNTDSEVAVRKAHASLKGEFQFGVLDGLEWADPLTDFNIYVHQLPRVFVMEHGFEEWVEDIEQLRALELESDLQSLLDGAPLLRSGYTFRRRLGFHAREMWRKLQKIWVFAQKGQKEFAIVALACGASLAGTAAILMFIQMMFTELFGSSATSHAKSD